MAAALVLGGCASDGGQVTHALPDLSRIPQRLLTKDEQSRAVQQLNADKERAEADALREIERRK